MINSGVLPIIFLASIPIARILLSCSETATTEGSFKTIPLPGKNTRVFAVPRSIPNFFESNPINPIYHICARIKNMKILTVIPFEKASFREDLTYFSAKDVAPGSIVKVTLRSKTLLGVVLSEEDASGAKGALKELDFNLKKILEVKENSVFRSEYMKAILDTSEYFLARKNDGASALIPSVLKEEYDKIIKWIDNDDEEKKIVKQNPDIRTEKLLLQTDFESRISFYKTLIRGNFAEKKSIFIVLPTEAEVKNFENLLKTH